MLGVVGAKGVSGSERIYEEEKGASCGDGGGKKEIPSGCATKDSWNRPLGPSDRLACICPPKVNRAVLCECMLVFVYFQDKNSVILQVTLTKTSTFPSLKLPGHMGSYIYYRSAWGWMYNSKSKDENK